MSEKKEKESEKKKKITLAHIMVSRCDIGVEIYAKSKVIEEFIKKTYSGDTMAGTAIWNTGHRLYKKPNAVQHPTIEATRHTPTLGGAERNELVDGSEMLNMSFLRIVGLSEGVRVKFRGLYRETDIAGIAQSINEGIKNLFKEYNTPTCYEIEVTTEK